MFFQSIQGDCFEKMKETRNRNVTKRHFLQRQIEWCSLHTYSKHADNFGMHCANFYKFKVLYISI
jgi:hypothetical protein